MIPPFDASPVCHLDFSSQLNDDLRRELVFIATLQKKDTLIAQQTAFFTPTKHLSLRDPAITAKVQIKDGELHIDLTASSFARLVELTLEGVDVVFSDNYFDLPAGRTVTITTPLPANWTLTQAEAALKIRSVHDSYAHGASK